MTDAPESSGPAEAPADPADQPANLPLGPEDADPSRSADLRNGAEDDRAAYVRSLIASRCPELSTDDLALLGEPDPDAIPASIGVQILEVLDRLMDRMDRMEARAGA